MEKIIEAIYSKKRIDILQEINIYIEKLRVFFRISYDRKYISTNQFEFICTEIEETGKMIGGWIKSPARIGNLFDKVCSFENLYSAYKKAARGTKGKKETDEFCFFLEYELLKLKRELLSGKYRAGRYKYFTIQDPKEREIAVAPFRDRVVHHAIINIMSRFMKKYLFMTATQQEKKKEHTKQY